MRAPSDFKKCDDSTKQDVELFIEYLWKFPVTIAATDVGDEKEFDIVWVYDDKGTQKEVTFELKSDTYIGKTGNIAVEVVSWVKYWSIGCFLKTKADYIVYIDTDSKDARIMYREKSQQCFLDNLVDPEKEVDRYKLKHRSTKDGSGTLRWTKFYPVPENDFKKWGCIKNTINLTTGDVVWMAK